MITDALLPIQAPLNSEDMIDHAAGQSVQKLASKTFGRETIAGRD